MNVMFISLVAMENLQEQSIYCDLLKVFSRHGHQVIAVSPREKRTGLPTEWDETGEFSVLRVAIGNVTKNGPIEKGISLLRLRRVIEKAIDRYLSGFKPDVILFTTPPTTISGLVGKLKRRYGAKTYLLLKDIFPQNSLDIGLLSEKGIKGLIYRYFKSTERSTYKVADYIGCMSPANRAYLLEHEPWFDAKRVEVNPNSLIPARVDIEKRETYRKNLGIAESENVLVYGGNLGKPQAIDVLIQALRANEQRHSCTFIIAGDGTDRKKLEAYFAAEMPKRAHLLPSLSRREFDSLLGAANAGLILLDNRFSIPNYPSRLLSYLQAELPVVVASDDVTDMGQIAEREGFGIRCSSARGDNILSACDRLFSMDCRSMGRKGRSYFESAYSADLSYRIIERHFNE